MLLILNLNEHSEPIVRQPSFFLLFSESKWSFDAHFRIYNVLRGWIVGMFLKIINGTITTFPLTILWFCHNIYCVIVKSNRQRKSPSFIRAVTWKVHSTSKTLAEGTIVLSSRAVFGSLFNFNFKSYFKVIIFGLQ